MPMATQPRRRPLARRLADELIGMRDRLAPPNPSIDAPSTRRSRVDGGPVVISDGADNPGGGAASDATFFLQADRRARHPQMSPSARSGIRSRRASPSRRARARAWRCASAARSARCPGDPLDLDCTVKAIRLEHVQTGLSNTRTEMGDSALVEANGVEILLCSLRNQAMGTDLFTGIGCDLAAKKIVVVKSSQHFHASYSKVARGSSTPPRRAR